MKKVFMKKRRLKLKYKLLLLMIIIISFIKYSYKLLSNVKLFDNNENFIEYLMIDFNNYYLNKSKIKDNLYTFAKRISNIDSKDPDKLLLTSFGKLDNKSDVSYVSKAKYIENNIKKRVYIYNTHQSETYKLGTSTKYDKNPDVKDVSLILSQKLKEKGVDVVVLESDLIEFMHLNNMNQNYGYDASRIFLKDELSKNSFDLIIDLHRDAIRRDEAYTLIDNKSYAKVLFVIGTNHKNYKKNEAVAKKISNIISDNYKNITRGIYKTNYKYNQDLNENIILLELGASVNTIDEVENTIEVLSESIVTYLGEI